ncbi:STAS/SEC14 domain-containing protein [Shewanella sp. A3A]|uniref:STAS/SEC14 domain-containing protein n=1 Tax=Shewanella electrica TaxID=515560 RepID=A0ABT2FI59_9GAMM|nr:STAS/SEC14 domain-containing protein [Shewanella electrica]MCH1918161.1 STAS/SEC14 domain-containing protein [Shewanella ferrihydritica]MCH1924083.1 STAS/SEC14 domain-containing protein [Shewanella electrica]MCS4555986.1 STAS/SEC14 domain-containing protein [Shewanella electrica]
MLCQIPDISKGIISLFASGRISALDYRTKLQPAIKSYRQDWGQVCLYIEADVLLEGWDMQSLSGVGEVQLPAFDALVFVGGPDWVGNAVRLLGPFVSGEIAWFPLEHKQDAIGWIRKRSHTA